MYRAAIISMMVLVASVLPAQRTNPEPVPVEVWCGGDDGLTLRLRDAVESAFKASPDFSMSFGKKPGTLVVTIPTHVEWKKVDAKTLVRYTVEFSVASGHPLMRTIGNCWDNEFQKCAARILNDAKDAARKIR